MKADSIHVRIPQPCPKCGQKQWATTAAVTADAVRCEKCGIALAPIFTRGG